MFEPKHTGPQGLGAFSQSWQAPPPRFAPWGNPPEPSGIEADIGDGSPLGSSESDDVWLSGYAAGKAEAEAELAREAAAMDALLQALDRLAPLPDPLFAERLEREVRSLLAQLVGTASIDEALLIERCAELAELASGDAATILHAHPDDAVMLSAAQPGLTIVADPRQPRGELLLIDGVGEVAAGPRTMLADWAVQAGDDLC
jgi:hypothetical protein